MIWSSDTQGSVTYASPEWVDFTGQPVASAFGDGWLDLLHPEDVPGTVDTFRRACLLAAPFTVWYRLKHQRQGYVQVVSAAMPSISLIDKSFIGYLGALSEAEAAEGRQNQIGQFLPNPASAKTKPSSPVDIVADYLLLARATAKAAGEIRLVPSLDFAISEVTRRLGIPSDEKVVH